MTRPDQPGQLDEPSQQQTNGRATQLIELPYNPRAEFGDPDWREPVSDDEAAARTAWIDAQPRSPGERAWHERVLASANEHDPLDDPTERLRLAQLDRGDPEELADAEEEYRAALAAAESRDREQATRQQQQQAQRRQQRQRGDEEAEL